MKIVTLNSLNQFRKNIECINGEIPIGSIIAYSSDNIPNNYLLCDGSEISRTKYKDLFDIIETTYGNGDGTTTFNLPDLKGKVLVGKDENDIDFNTIGKEYGEKEHTLIIDEIPGHNHQAIWQRNSNDANTGSYNNVGVAQGSIEVPGMADRYTSYTGGNGSHNNIQPSTIVNYIIKAYNPSIVRNYEVHTLSCDPGKDIIIGKDATLIPMKYDDNPSDSLIIQSDGSIKIGKNVNRIMISACCSLPIINSFQLRRLNLFKNNVSQSRVIFSGDSYQHFSIPFKSINVQEDDIISLKMEGSIENSCYVSANKEVTWMTIVIIG